MSSSKSIYIVAGEASGDLHAAYLVEELLKKDPSLSIRGLGGQLMQKAGVKLDLDFTQMAVVGFWEVVKHYGDFKRIFDCTIERLQNDPPAAIILVDYPGFNLRLARRIKQLNIPTKIIYYISPQVWAWKAGRVENVRNDVDRMLVLFKFEKDFYARYRIKVDFVGHPLVDHAKPQRTREDTLKSLGLSPDKKTIGLLPGSRLKEVDRHLPSMITAVKILRHRYPDLQCVAIQASTISEDFIRSFAEGLPLTVASQNTYDVIAACDVCLVASGTATLETALLETPMVVMYKTSWPTYWLARHFIKIPYIALVNIVAQKPVVPELIQEQASPEHLADLAGILLSDPVRRDNMRKDLKEVRAALGNSGAVEKAAKIVLETI